MQGFYQGKNEEEEEGEKTNVQELGDTKQRSEIKTAKKHEWTPQSCPWSPYTIASAQIERKIPPAPGHSTPVSKSQIIWQALCTS